MPIQNLRAEVKSMFKEEDVVFSYSTKMAVQDGVLIPIPVSFTGPFGIRFPVYFNDSVWTHYVNPNGEPDQSLEKSREISSILKGYVSTARGCSSSTCTFQFTLTSALFLTDQRNEVLNKDGSLTATLKAVISAEDFDRPNPAVFIMLPWED